ncbi:ribulokinase [Niabella ginsenosidivorans]|uniref:Ribulokinase n=1 Tax=Niabella ginsenosidivorans TaxID=1176587 RepID=A0A1A9I1K3_9BACT|nr:ribulokinase [Niabella ginsenosidivorans]ANH81528.1 ribulokinase [Niabella ginsenosidivorans]
MKKAYVIGVDYGTDSVRSVIVNALNGQEIAASVFYYPRWKKGLYCDPAKKQFRQHPLDYIEGLEATIKDCIQKAGPEVAAQIRSISVDTTGSSPVAVDKTGTPLALNDAFKDNPNALFILWKDHTSTKEAMAINEHAKKFDINYLQYVGGIYSSEWYWAKLLHIFKTDAAVRAAAASWVEHADWIPFLLTGGSDVSRLKRGVCTAGHKALWSEAFGGFPPNAFFATLDPVLDGFVDHLPKETFAADVPAGTISEAWAGRLGLPSDVLVGIGAMDAHMGAVGGQIEPYYLSKVMGTSTCDMLVVPKEDLTEGKTVKGICGQVTGSVIPAMIGLEAGQSAFGDVYAWFKNLLSWPLQLIKGSEKIDAAAADAMIEEISAKIIPALAAEAAKLPLQEQDLYAIDWLNGRRTPDANQLLHGALTGLGLGSDAPQIFKALVEATCFGAKAIVDRFEEEGIRLKGLIGVGGVAKKSPYIMQVMADVMGMPIRIHRSEQTCAIGAAMFAATVAGIYPRVEEAMLAMGQGFDREYLPDAARHELYRKRMKQYKKIGAFLESNNL